MDVRFKESVRKVIHVSSIALIPVDMLSHEIALYGFIGVGFLYIMTILLHNRGVNLPLIEKLVEIPSRRGEMSSLIGSPTYFFISAILLLAFAPSILAYIAIVALAIGDTFATIFGMGLGGPRFLGRKTVSGSIGFFASTFLTLLLFVPYPAAAAIAFVGMVAEALSSRFDNFTIPIATFIAADVIVPHAHDTAVLIPSLF